ncbi:hypothetical protein [Niabella hirudinis]|uniref:hypothetical protein n=1 Tax=Niabella hirudinis TaxID=1285929 RepID=UPI003EB98024
MKPLIEQYSLVETDQTKYALKQSEEIQLKSRLNSYKARQLFEMLKQGQPERFHQMIKEGKLIPFLNDLSNQYLRKIQQQIDKGMNEAEAAEIQWPLLMEQAGLK